MGLIPSITPLGICSSHSPQFCQLGLDMLPVSFLFLLISLLPVQSLNCLHGSTPLNTTKVSCPVKQTRWCYSIQNGPSHLLFFPSRGCDEKSLCERLKFVGSYVVAQSPLSNLSFTSYSFCFQSMNQSICCCDRDNCNGGNGGETVRKALFSSHSMVIPPLTHLLPLLFISIVI